MSACQVSAGQVPSVTHPAHETYIIFENILDIKFMDGILYELNILIYLVLWEYKTKTIISPLVKNMDLTKYKHFINSQALINSYVVIRA